MAKKLSFPSAHFRSWSDGSNENPRTIVVTRNITLQALFGDELGIGDRETEEHSFEVSAQDLNIHVIGASGKAVTIYDLYGRQVAFTPHADSDYVVTMPAAGVYLVRPEGLDRVEHQLLFAQRNAELGVCRLGDLFSGHRAEQLAARAAFGGDFDALPAQLLRRGDRRGAVLRLFPAARRVPELHGVDGVRRRWDRELAREQIVARVALGGVDQLALLALSADVLL